MKNCILVLLLGLLFVVAGTQQAQPLAPVTAFSFEATSNNFIAFDYTDYEVTEPDFTFTADRNSSSGVDIDLIGTNPDNGQFEGWDLKFSAPFNAPLSVGRYENATRHPGVDAEDAGLAMTGNARGSNVVTGSFEVFEVEYGPNNSVVRFAANFTQFGEGQESQRIDGRIRFNSTVPLSVPEPASLGVLLGGLGVLAGRRRR